MRNRTYPIALGGMLAAASVVIMSIGTIVPVATYAAPVVCMMVGQVVLKLCSSRIACCSRGVIARFWDCRRSKRGVMAIVRPLAPD